jgi:hypothetical protein
MPCNERNREKEGTSVPTPQGPWELQCESPVHNSFKVSLEERLYKAEQRREVWLNEYMWILVLNGRKTLGVRVIRHKLGTCLQRQFSIHGRLLYYDRTI